MSDGRDNQFAVILETYEAAIKKVIDTRRQQQTIVAVEAFFIS